jgi:hypothetical protein
MTGEVGVIQNSALQICIYGLIIIFGVIITLALVFSLVSKTRNYIKNGGSRNLNANGEKLKNSNIPAGDSAAIAAAIYLFMDEIHDNENRVVTIKRVSRTYSPWNSKIYGINWIKNR